MTVVACDQKDCKYRNEDWGQCEKEEIDLWTTENLKGINILTCREYEIEEDKEG